MGGGGIHSKFLQKYLDKNGGGECIGEGIIWLFIEISYSEIPNEGKLGSFFEVFMKKEK